MPVSCIWGDLVEKCMCELGFTEVLFFSLCIGETRTAMSLYGHLMELFHFCFSGVSSSETLIFRRYDESLKEKKSS